MPENDFFDLGTELLNDSDINVNEETAVSLFKYLIVFSKDKESCLTDSYTFKKKDVSYISEIMSISGCIENFIITDKNGKEIDDDFYKNEIWPYNGYLYIFFNLRDNFNVESFRRFLYSLMKIVNPISIENLTMGYYDKKSSPHCHFLPKTKMLKMLNPEVPEISVFSAFSTLGMTDKYLEKYDLTEIIRELHRRIIFRAKKAGDDKVSSIKDKLNDYSRTDSLVGLVQVYSVVGDLKDREGIVPESNSQSMLVDFISKEDFKERNLSDELIEDINKAMQSEVVSYVYDEDNNTQYKLNWHKKIIYSYDIKGGENVKYKAYFVISVSKVDYSSPDNFDFSIKIFEKNHMIKHLQFDHMLVKTHWLIKRFLLNLFDVYNDCFKYTYVEDNYSDEHSMQIITGNYTLNENIDSERFNMFLKELMNYQKILRMPYFSIKLIRNSDNFAFMSMERQIEKSIILFVLFWFHYKETSFASNFRMKKVIKELSWKFMSKQVDLNDASEMRNKILMFDKTRLFISLFNICKYHVLIEPKIFLYERKTNSDNFYNSYGNEQQIEITDFISEKELKELKNSDVQFVSDIKVGNITRKWKWYTKIIHYKNIYEIPCLVVDACSNSEFDYRISKK